MSVLAAYRFGSAWLVLCLLGCAVPVPPAQAPASPARRISASQRFASPYAYEWFVRAELLRGRRQLIAAVEAYRTALASADEDPHVLARLATALAEAGEQAEADRALERALALDPGSELAWLARAGFAEARGDQATAYEAYERAEQADPLSPRAPLALAQLLEKHGFGERASAVRLRYQARSLSGTRAAQAAQLTAAIAARDPTRVFTATLPYRLEAPAAVAPLNLAAKLLVEHAQPLRALRVLELVPEHARDPELYLRLLLASGRWAAADNWLTLHGPNLLDQHLVARAYLAVARPELTAQLIEAERSHEPASAELQLLAAEAQLALGAASEAALGFARIAAGSSVYREARTGLQHALQAEGLEALAEEFAQPMAAAGAQ